MSHLKMRDNTQIYYIEEGTGRPIIMLHGWKASSDVYQKVSEELSSGFRCIRYDQRGHKRSGIPDQPPRMGDLADDLDEIIRVFCPVEKPLLIGWSMGGATVLEYIERYGCEKIDGVILVDISPCILNNENWNLGRAGGTYTEEHLTADMSVMSVDFREFMRKYYSETNAQFREMTSAEREGLLDQRLAGFDTGVLTSLWESLCRADYRPTLPRISVPAAIFHASILPACRPETAAYYAQTIPGGAHCVQFKDASHALIAEYPKLFSKEVRDFIALGKD